jgi:hypothetical protein
METLNDHNQRERDEDTAGGLAVAAVALLVSLTICYWLIAWAARAVMG